MNHYSFYSSGAGGRSLNCKHTAKSGGTDELSRRVIFRPLPDTRRFPDGYPARGHHKQKVYGYLMLYMYQSGTRNGMPESYRNPFRLKPGRARTQTAKYESALDRTGRHAADDVLGQNQIDDDDREDGERNHRVDLPHVKLQPVGSTQLSDQDRKCLRLVLMQDQ